MPNTEIREYSGSTPVILNTNGTNLIDWSITGKAAGVGKKSNNYIDLSSTVTVPNGQAEGSDRVPSVNPDYDATLVST